ATPCWFRASRWHRLSPALHRSTDSRRAIAGREAWRPPLREDYPPGSPHRRKRHLRPRCVRIAARHFCFDPRNVSWHETFVIRSYKDKLTAAIADGEHPKGFPADLIKATRR